MRKTLCLFILAQLLVLSSLSYSIGMKLPPRRHVAVPVDKAIIYELFIRNFSPEGTINAIIPRLKDLKEMGINTIWLMPIQPTGKLNHKGTYGSPYSIQDYYAVNPEFG